MSGPGLIAFPPTATTVTFPFDEPEAKFDSSFYRPEFTDGRASEEEINTVLRDLDGVMGPMIAKLKAAGRNVVISQFVMFAIAFVFFYLADKINPYFLALGILCLLYAAIGPCIIMKMLISQNYQQLVAKSQVIVDKHNQNLASRGLRWDLSPYFPKRIELRKDYNSQVTGDHTTIDVSQVNQQSYGGQQYVPPSAI